eukprot:1359101-Amorphochlora_amoeboformis.AAC.2
MPKKGRKRSEVPHGGKRNEKGEAPTKKARSSSKKVVRALIFFILVYGLRGSGTAMFPPQPPSPSPSQPGLRPYLEALSNSPIRYPINP